MGVEIPNLPVFGISQLQLNEVCYKVSL